jgi:hypothetical protein
MLEHMKVDHTSIVSPLRNDVLAAKDFIFSHCSHRAVSKEDVEDLKAGRKTVKLVKPNRGREAYRIENIREVVTSLQSPRKATTSRSRTRSPRRLLTRTCFVCEQRIAADVSRLACKLCTVAVCMLPACREVLEVEPAHEGCRKEPEHHGMNDFELQEPSYAARK